MVLFGSGWKFSENVKNRQARKFTKDFGPFLRTYELYYIYH